MHSFSLHTPSGKHVGFLIMLPDDEHELPPQSGSFAFQLQDENDSEVRALVPYQGTDVLLTWVVTGDAVQLFCEDEPVGKIRQEYLVFKGNTLLLNDLTGTI